MDKVSLQERISVLEKGIQEIQTVIQQNMAQQNAYTGALSELKEWLSRCEKEESKNQEDAA